MEKIKVGIVDDHVLLRNALAGLIDTFSECKVMLQASEGGELLQQLKKGIIPDVLLLDLHMPGMDGYEAAMRLQADYPELKTLVITMYESDQTLIRLLHHGVKGFLQKDIHPSELKQAIIATHTSGFYYSNQASSKMANFFRATGANLAALSKGMLTDDEIRFLKLSCTEVTYKEIAIEMNYNPRAIDSLREHLFDKLDVKSRVGLAMYAIRHGLVGI